MTKKEHKRRLKEAVANSRQLCWDDHVRELAAGLKRQSDMLNTAYRAALDELNKKHERELIRRDAVLAGANRQLGKYERQIGELHREINQLKKVAKHAD